MDNSTLTAIGAPPTTYYTWLECLELLKQRPLCSEEWEHLYKGTCPDSSSCAYLEEPIVDTVNAVLKRYIAAFRRDMDMYGSQNAEDMYTLFATLARQLRTALFFESLTFLREDFRQELGESVRKEATGYWNRVLRSLYDACMETGDIRLEDQWYMIRRIVLFTT